MIYKLLSKLFKRLIISDEKGDPYLTRWVILKSKLFIHCFHRSDLDPYLHDHPWDFWSLILWGGYWEETKEGFKWYCPLTLLKRSAEYQHRVEIPKGKTCWTIIWCGPKIRNWGFWLPEGFVQQDQFFKNQKVGRI